MMNDIVITNSIENITYILKGNFDAYGKGPIFKSKFQLLLGDGIFNTDGDLWYKHRKTSAHLFNLNKFRTTVLDTFNRHCDTLVGIIGETCDSKPNEPVLDVAALMFKFTLDSIGFIAFGKEIGALQKNKVDFADCFDHCQQSINDSFINPLWFLKRYFTPNGWYYFYCLWVVDKYALEVVREKKDSLCKANNDKKVDVDVASKSGGGDMLSLYLDRAEADPNAPKLTDRFLRDVVLNFIIAGRDTTAQALSWCFYRLCIHSEIQRALRKDIMAVLRKHNNDAKSHCQVLSYECLQSMKYLEAFCMEVLRLHPSVPKEAKHAGKDDTLPDGTSIKKGDLVVFSPWLMGRTEDLWEDCNAFKPSRFYTVNDSSHKEFSSNISLTKPSPFVFTAFQAGPRTCLGQSLALLEMKCCLARLLSAFEFELAQPVESVTYLNSITLPIKGGLKVFAKRVASQN